MTDPSRSEVTETGTFAASPPELWTLVADFGGLHKFMDIDPYETVGEGVGAKRSIPMGDGVVVEVLDALDDEAMSLTYSITSSPLPFKDYSATMVVTPSGEGSLLTWTGTFEADGIPTEKAERLASGIYKGGIAGYAKALGE